MLKKLLLLTKHLKKLLLNKHMQIQDCYYLGLIAKLHGFKGEVSLFLDVTHPADYQGLDALYLDINGQLTPFFIEGFKLKNKGFAAIKFEGIATEEAAQRLVKKKARARSKLFLRPRNHRFPGFRLHPWCNWCCRRRHRHDS